MPNGLSAVCAASKLHREFRRHPLFQLARRHCVPIQAIAQESREPGGLKIVGGTALLWQTIEGRFFVTACHVWRDILTLLRHPSGKYHLIVHNIDGMFRITKPILVDECEELDLAVFTVDGIKDYTPGGKAFLQSLTWPIAPIGENERVLGCGYPGDARIFKNGQFDQHILFWIHKRCSVSKSGTRTLLDGQTGRSKVSYFTADEPEDWGLPGISGAPLFALRENALQWVGTVRSGVGKVAEPHSIQATPSVFVGSDGRIVKPCPKTSPGECDCGQFLSPLRTSIGGRIEFIE
jgi:hypothetical protein